METWINLTAADLQLVMSSDEYAEFTAAIVTPNGAATVAANLSERINYVRGFLARGGFLLGPDGMMAPELKYQTLALTRLILCQQVASLRTFTENAKPAAEAAETLLEKKVLKGEFAVSSPLVAGSTLQGAPRSESVSPGGFRVSRDDLNSI